MTLLPIVGRELRVAARRTSTFWIRAGVVSGAVLLSVWMFLVMYRSSNAERGRFMFVGLSALAFAYCASVGLLTTADSLSAEKREDTLGLLFLTDLKGHDIVLGKLAATSLHALYGLVAILPVLTTPLLLGGVTLKHIGQLLMVLLVTIAFSLSAGLAVSSVSRSGFRALVGTLLLLLLFGCMLPILGFCWAKPWNGPVFGPWVDSAGGRLVFSGPVSAFYMTVMSLFLNVPAQTLSRPLWTTLIEASALLSLAMLAAPRSWQQEAPRAWANRWAQHWAVWRLGRAAWRRSARDRWLAVNPCAWLRLRFRLKPAAVWFLFSLPVAFYAWGAVVYWNRGWFEQPGFVLIPLWMHTVFKVHLALEATYPLTEERRTGALELVLTTPVPARTVLAGHLRALHHQFAGPLLGLLIVDLLALAAAALTYDLQYRLGNYVWVGAREWVNRQIRDQCWLFASGMAVLLADYAALCWLGLWCGLTAKNLSRAVARVVGWVLIWPWAAFLGALAIVILLGELGIHRFSGRDTGVLFILVWAGIGLANSAFWWWWARRRLRRQLRLAAARRYLPPSPWWQRLLGVRSKYSTNAPVARGRASHLLNIQT